MCQDGNDDPACKKAIGWYAGVKEERYTSLSDEPAKEGGGENLQTDANCASGLDPPT